MELNLRLATSNDLAAVQEIISAAYTPYIARIGREPGPMFDDYRALIAHDQVYIAEDKGVVQGLLVLIPQDDAMLLDSVAVAPSAQGLGVGRGLLEFAERAAIEANYAAVRLYTNEAMIENIALYTRIGYVETHRIEENGLRRVYMIKLLFDA